MDNREAAKARVRAKVAAEKALPASERIANMLHATHTHADAQALLAAFRAEVLREAAEVAESLRQFEPAFGARESAQVSENLGVLRVADKLRSMASTRTVSCFDVELDNGENLKDLGVGNVLELDQPTAGMEPGAWLLVAYEGDFQDRARLRRLSRDEIDARRRADAMARIYE
ncbi:hypothetical protein [Streptomyces tubercidicus]|uniref:hypothetical protein n=1 Tax=Streptomyces tubercidicus TaxID=47759 RepID=UPI0034673078